MSRIWIAVEGIADNFAARMPLLDVKFFATAVLIQRKQRNLPRFSTISPRWSRAVQDSPAGPRATCDGRSPAMC